MYGWVGDSCHALREYANERGTLSALAVAHIQTHKWAHNALGRDKHTNKRRRRRFVPPEGGGGTEEERDKCAFYCCTYSYT